MTLSEFSIRHSVFAWMLMAGLILFGSVAFTGMGISERPDVDFPVVTVTLKYEGAAAEVMETDIVDIVEDAVMSVQGIKSVSSSSRREEATVSVEFELDRDIDAAVQEVQTKLAQAQRLLPDAMDPPIVTKTNPEDQPIMWVSLSGDKPLREIIEYARDHVKDRLQTVSGVGEVILGGYIAPAMRVWVDPRELARRDLSIQDVVEAIGREHAEVPAGRLETSTRELSVRALGEVDTPEELGNILIKRRGGAVVYKPIALSEVATVEKGLDDVRRISRTGGRPSIGLGVKKQRGENAVRVADDVKARLETIRKTLPPGYSVQVNFDTTTFIRDSVHEMRFNLILAAALTAVVCLLFLASWGATFNVLLAIPTSIIGAFIALYFLGFTLNTFTLLGLTLAIGIVVDDAIMVLENIMRHRELGESPFEAAKKGAREITGAALATTIALIAIFIPVVFMQGIIGKFLYQYGITMAVAVALSLVEALTLTPMRAVRLLEGARVAPSTKAKLPLSLPLSRPVGAKFAAFTKTLFDRLASAYGRALGLCLRHRALVLVAALLVFAVSLAVLPQLKKELVPAQDQSVFIIRIQTPLGSSIGFTDDKMKRAEAIISRHPEVIRYFSAVGGFSGGEVDAGMVFVTMPPPKERPVHPDLKRRLSQADLIGILRKELSAIPDVKVVLQDLSTRGFTADRGFPVEFSVRGPEWGKLAHLSEQLIAEMKKNPEFVDVDSDYRLGQPEIEIVPDRGEAARRGVEIQAIGETVNALVGGIKVGRFTEGGRRNDIRIRLKEGARQTPEDIAGLYVRNVYGELVRLGDVASISERETLKSITRKDRERAISIFANINPAYSQDVALKKVSELGKPILSEPYRLVWSGSAQALRESFSSLLFALYLGVAVAYMVLASQYNSFVHPVVVLLALPFSISGALVALWLVGASLNIYSFIGIILLMGIAKKNAILLVDFTNKRRAEGLDKTRALLAACPTRLRPILMTSVATVAAAVPPALALGPGAETRIPMAVVIIGGILVSTFLTLFVVPCAYSLFASLERRREPLP